MGGTQRSAMQIIVQMAPETVSGSTAALRHPIWEAWRDCQELSLCCSIVHPWWQVLPQVSLLQQDDVFGSTAERRKRSAGGANTSPTQNCKGLEQSFALAQGVLLLGGTFVVRGAEAMAPWSFLVDAKLPSVRACLDRLPFDRDV